MITNFEIIFWKVIHNKYLLNQIIKQIHSTELNYSDHKLYNVNNRIKFKNIHSFKWLLNNKQYKLLIDKIKYGDFIKFDKESIKTFLLSTCVSGNGDQTVMDIKLFKEILILLMDFKRIEFEIIDLIKACVEIENLEALNILTNEKYMVVIESTTLEWSIENSSPLIVESLLNIQQQLSTITEETRYKSLKLAINNRYHKEEMVNLVLNRNLYKIPPPSLSRLDYSMEIQEKSSKRLKLSALTNNTYDEELLYPYKSKLEHLFLIKSTELQNRLLDLDCFFKQTDNLIRKAEKLLYSTLDSSSLDFFLVYIRAFYKFYCKNCSNTTISVIQQKINNIMGNEKTTCNMKLKELQKLMVTETRRKYLQYMYRYDEIIEEMNYIIEGGSDSHVKLIIIYCFKSLSPTALQYLLNHSEGTHYLNTSNSINILSICGGQIYHLGSQIDNLLIKTKLISKYPQRTIEFIKLYSTLSSNIINNYPIDYIEIVIEIILLESSELYLELIKVIPEFKIQELQLPLEWHPLLPKLFTPKPIKETNDDIPLIWIQDNKIIDLISNCSRLFSNYIKLRRIGKIKCESFELAYYAYQVQLEELSFENSLFEYPFIQSVNGEHQLVSEGINQEEEEHSVNVIVLDKLGSLDIKLNLKHEGNCCGNINIPFYNIKKLVSYFNNCGKSGCFGSNTRQLFYRVLQDLIKNGSSEIENDLNGINLNLYPKESIRVLVQSIDKYNQWGIHFILNNLFKNGSNRDINYSDLFKNIWDRETIDGKTIVNEIGELVYSGKLLYNNQNHIVYCNQDPLKVIETIKYWVKEKEYKENKSIASKLIVFYETIINRLFQILLSTRQVSCEQVLMIHNLIVNESCIAEEGQQRSLYHTFRYLNIKSPKLVKLILEKPIICDLLNSTGDNVYDANVQFYGQYGYFDVIPKLLDTDKFNCHTVLSLSFNQVFNLVYNYFSNVIVESLKEQDLLKLPAIIRDFYVDNLNHDLGYLLDIDRIDLFFKELKHLKANLQDQQLANNKTLGPSFPRLTTSIQSAPVSSILPGSIFCNDMKQQFQIEQQEHEKGQQQQQKKQKDQEQEQEQQQKIIKSFPFSDKLISKVVTKFNVEQIQKFIQFNYTEDKFHQVLLKESIEQSNLETTSFILDNYSIVFEDFDWISIFRNNNYIIAYYLLNNRNNQVFKKLLDLNYYDDTGIYIDIFTTSFIHGNIRLCELILKSSNENTKFDIPHYLIEGALQLNNNHIVRYYKEKCLIK